MPHHSRIQTWEVIVKLTNWVFSIGYYIKNDKHKIAWQVIHYISIQTICRNSHFPHEMIYLRHKYFHLISCNTRQISSVWPFITFQFAWDDKIEITFIMLQKNEVAAESWYQNIHFCRCLFYQTYEMFLCHIGKHFSDIYRHVFMILNH